MKKQKLTGKNPPEILMKKIVFIQCKKFLQMNIDVIHFQELMWIETVQSKEVYKALMHK